MTTQQKKQNQKLQKKTASSPTETIKSWIQDFVTKPNPVFGNLPPCPFAQKAIIENKVTFLELDSVASYPTLYQHILEADFEEIDVLCMIAQPDQFTTSETEKLAKDLNGYFDVVSLIGILHHMPNPKMTLELCSSFLKKDGIIAS